MGKKALRLSITFRTKKTYDDAKKASAKEKRTIAYWVNDAVEQRLAREAAPTS